MVAQSNKYTEYLQFPLIRKFLDEVVTLMRATAFARVRAVAFSRVQVAVFALVRAGGGVRLGVDGERRGVEEYAKDEAGGSDPTVRRRWRRSSAWACRILK
jgi:hypothetical protein